MPYFDQKAGFIRLFWPDEGFWGTKWVAIVYLYANFHVHHSDLPVRFLLFAEPKQIIPGFNAGETIFQLGISIYHSYIKNQ